MGKNGDTIDDVPKMALRALASGDPDLQPIKEQIATADPQLRRVLEQYLASWFLYNQRLQIIE